MDTALMDPVERLRTALADRYEIDREIGRGGMASVYQARDRQQQLPTASSSRCSSRKIHGREPTLGRSPFHSPAALRAAGQGAPWVPP
jgi:serine/threonine protein kinase